MFTFVSSVIQKSGVGGVFLLMLLENLVPVIPSELIMPMAGFEAARGAFHPAWAIIAGTVGSIAGGFAWYWLGRRWGCERMLQWVARHEKWLTFSSGEVARARDWFQRWGGAAVCVGRMVPGVRGVICIPAGIVEMSAPSFLIWSSLGALIWSALLTLAGYALQARYSVVSRWLNPVTDGIVVLCVAVYVCRLAWRLALRHSPK